MIIRLNQESKVLYITEYIDPQARLALEAENP
jgi:hypothetical protein